MCASGDYGLLRSQLTGGFPFVSRRLFSGRKRTSAIVAATNAGLRRHPPVVLVPATKRLPLLSCRGGTKLVGVGLAESQRGSELERVLQALLQD